MKIAVIGSGIVGYVASSYLSDLDTQIVYLKINKISSSSNKEIKEKKKFERPVSSKFGRKDFLKNNAETENIFPKKKFNL